MRLLIIIALTLMACNSEKAKTPINNNAWTLEQLTDEFGDPIEGKFVKTAIFEGTFSNSVAQNKDLSVVANITNNDDGSESFLLRLVEYNQSPASLPNKEFGKMKIKLPDGVTHILKVFFYEGYVMISSDNELDFLELIRKYNNIKVILDLSTASEYYNSTYRFTTHNEGLSSI